MDTAENVVADTRTLLDAGPRVNEVQASIDRLEAKKASIIANATSSIGAKPVLNSSVASLKQDEFETSSEFKARVKQHEAVARREYEKRLTAWEVNKKQQESLRDKRLDEIARENRSLANKLAEITKERDQQQHTKRNYDGWLIWGSRSNLPRYDADTNKFPGIRLRAETVAIPDGAVILYRGKSNDRDVVLLSEKQFASSNNEYDFRISDRETARTFKQDWADGKVMVANSCQCELKLTQQQTEVVVRNAVTRTETESSPDYSGFAMSVLKGVINEAAPGSFDPASQYDGYNALHRKKTRVIELRPREAFVADAIVLSVAIDAPKVFRVVDGGKVEPYAGVEMLKR